MHHKVFVAYYRVSTARQGRSGLGLEAQRAAVAEYVSAVNGEVVAEFEECETGKGSNALERRAKLREALACCRRRGATLVIAKLDRLGRNLHFISGLIDSGVHFVAADMPTAEKAMLQVFATFAEYERDLISKRTREALAAAKARGVVIGATWKANLALAQQTSGARAGEFAERVRPVLESCVQRGLSQRAIAAELNRLGVTAPGGRSWHLTTVQRLFRRLRTLDQGAYRSPK